MAETELPVAEQNARAAALGNYSRWLLRRFRKLDVVELASDMADPISLRQVFVPVRLALEDVRDEDLGKVAERPEEEQEPGEAAWEVLGREPFVALSGRPGSGKTTLVQAVISELCGGQPSVLRSQTRAIPVPFILRGIPGLDQVVSLEQLFDAWWPGQEEQAAADGMALDRTRLSDVLQPVGDAQLQEQPVLLLLDGIDEVGGVATRQRLLDVAVMARDRGYRVLITGRPTGLGDLQVALPLISPNQDDAVVMAIQPFHLLPFAWPQIDRFITHWYDLRGEWVRRKTEGVRQFKKHLADPHRRALLVLARRPIFLTLMALVHCTENQMPEGRARLYERIIDLYLDRQERHRQRQATLQGKPMPRHWPANETRLVLAHLAWRSQFRGSKGVHASEPHWRQFRWRQDDVVTLVRTQIAEGPGRFIGLRPHDAEDLVAFFLHPAGLLVAPTEGEVQLAHLSFQEYLCAWFLHERGVLEGLRQYLAGELFVHLDQPGWNEVGMLLLCIRAAATNNEGHFEVLGWLDPARCNQADLLVAAITGRELSFTDEERRAWLPIAVACALLHPLRGYGRKFRRVGEWDDAGLDLVVVFLEAGDDDLKAWSQLESCLRAAKVDRRVAPPPEMLGVKASQRWQYPSGTYSWDVTFGATEARAHSLIALVADSGWGLTTDPLCPIGNRRLEDALAAWLECRLGQGGESLLWRRPVRTLEIYDGHSVMRNVPEPTLLGLQLDRLVPNRGALWRRLAAAVPPDALLLQGEVLVNWFEEPAQRVILFSLHPSEAGETRTILGNGLYQAVMATEGAAEGRDLDHWWRSRATSRPWSSFRSHSRSVIGSQLRSMSRSLSVSLRRSMPAPASIELATAMSKAVPWLFSEETKRSLSRLYQLSQRPASATILSTDEVVAALAQYCLQHAAIDWFDKQAMDSALASRRGLRPGEPLPHEFGLLDDGGRLPPFQRRESFVRLRAWLDDDDAVLGFFFPAGLPADDQARLVDDLAIVREQPWSPQAGIDALLAGWSEGKPERDVTLAAAEHRLQAALDRALAELDGDPPEPS